MTCEMQKQGLCLVGEGSSMMDDKCPTCPFHLQTARIAELERALKAVRPVVERWESQTLPEIDQALPQKGGE